MANVTLCGEFPPDVKVHVTSPFTAIFTVSGLKLVPAPLAVTSAVVPSAATVSVDVAVRVVPPDVSVAVTVEPPGLTAITMPDVETDTDVPVVSANVAAGKPAMAAPFWSRGVALSCSVSVSVKLELAGVTDSVVNTEVGGGCVPPPPPPPPPHAKSATASARLDIATLFMQSPISRFTGKAQRAKLSHV